MAMNTSLKTLIRRIESITWALELVLHDFSIKQVMKSTQNEKQINTNRCCYYQTAITLHIHQSGRYIVQSLILLEALIHLIIGFDN